MRALALFPALLAIALAQAPPRDLTAAGVRAFQSGKYAEAETLLRRALEADPASAGARSYLAATLAYLAQDDFRRKRYDEALGRLARVLELDPHNQEAHYTIGAIAWTRWFAVDQEARKQLGMKPDEPGPLRNDARRAELRRKHLPALDDGIRHIEQALEIDPDSEDAMAYLNLLIRHRADLLDSHEEYKQEIDIADTWVQKALAARKAQAARK